MWQKALDEITDRVVMLERHDIPVTAMPDAAGRVRALEVRLARLRHRWNDEQITAARDPESEVGPSTFPTEQGAYGSVKPQVVGTQYRTVTTRSARRTFNTAAILTGTADGLGISTGEALTRLRQAGVVTMKVGWTALKGFAQANGLPLKVAQGSVPDDGTTDGAWVGEEWQEHVRQEAIDDEGRPV